MVLLVWGRVSDPAAERSSAKVLKSSFRPSAYLARPRNLLYRFCKGALGFVQGHGFSRAKTSNNPHRLLAAEVNKS
ncbi:hypothetical protein SBA2_40033 [Acidobacteriia bacterium SbA2]|nr:hypothetical protein SBA2_40033 [Acidobacteriia bacterium SbA2]